MNSLAFLSIELCLTIFAVILLVSVILRPRAEESTFTDPSASPQDDNAFYAPKIACLGFITSALFVPALWGKVGLLFHHAFRSDSFGLFFKVIFLVAGAFVTLISNDYQCRTSGKRSAEFFLLLMTAVLGACFLVSANDFLTFFISLELLTISAYILSAYPKTDARALEAGGKYLIIGAFSSAVMLFGIAFLYGSFGTVMFESIKQAFVLNSEVPRFAYIGIFLLIAGLGFKISAFPFQLWVPDVYEGSPTPLTAFLSIVSKAAGFGALIRIFFGVLFSAKIEFGLLFSLIAAATLLYGNLGAIPQIQGNFKRLLAFSGISHAGYLLMGVASGNSLGVAAVLYYLTAYAAASLIIFFVIVQLAPSESIPSFKGLFGRNALLGASLFIALLSLAGVPPLGGFFAKFLIIQSVVNQNMFALAFLGAINIVVSLYYYLMVIKTVYVYTSESSVRAISVSIGSQISIVGLTAVLILLGVFQTPLLNLIAQALS